MADQFKNIMLSILIVILILLAGFSLDETYSLKKDIEQERIDNTQVLNDYNKISQSLRIDIEELRLEIQYLKRYLYEKYPDGNIPIEDLIGTGDNYVKNVSG